ncbi:MAG TPA: hypothetical protein VNP98_13170 [Chthoniobacterales bacterium]|nr:hypothetical protein [Chthoniobacterales bacterium]
MSTRENQEIAGPEGVVTRKGFLRYGLLATAGAFAGTRLFAQSPASSASPGASPVVPNRPPPIEGDLVKQFVGAGHGNLDKVKEMLAAQPALINATWDWGGGDFETALGGASHMGRPDIARYLLENNARMDLFAAAMLGRLDIIKAAAAAFPNIVRVPGPHKIPLIAHAEKGGPDAAAVVEFLRTLAP